LVTLRRGVARDIYGHLTYMYVKGSAFPHQSYNPPLKTISNPRKPTCQKSRIEAAWATTLTLLLPPIRNKCQRLSTNFILS
jgi:hypothetical protein